MGSLSRFAVLAGVLFGLAAVPAVAVAQSPSLPAVVSGSTFWGLRTSLTTGSAVATFTLGTRPVVPFTGDWDGNGSETPGTYSGGVLRLYNQISPEATPTEITFGDPRGFPVAGDFDGDRRDDVAIYRNGTWQIRLAATGATSTVTFGGGSWPATVPVAGDWDGDGSDGIGTYTLASGVWTLRQIASTGALDLPTFVFWMGSGSYPVVGDWDANATDTVGVKIGATWFLNNQNDPSLHDVSFDYGAANDLPLTWKPAPSPLDPGGIVPEGKVDICNYVGTPGVDEMLDIANSPIEVAVVSLRLEEGDVAEVGDIFITGQGFAIVVAVAGDPQATLADCPG